MMKIYFDDILINEDYYTELSTNFSLFEDTFYLGSTASNIYNISIAKDSITKHPDLVLVKENGIVIAKLVVDKIEENDFEYKYTLTDKMIDLEFDYDATSIFHNGSATLLEIVQDICRKAGIELATTDFRGNNKSISWYDNTITAREYIGYVAELNGGYAQIGKDGKLYFIKQNTLTSKTINIDDCSDFKVGEKHIITRVVYEQGALKYEYGNETGNTLYLNSDNVFITEQTEVEEIFNEINGFEFYSFSTENCPIDYKIMPGQIVTFTDGINNYPTIVGYDLTYNGGWYGGYNLNVATKKQEETKTKGTNDKIKKLLIEVDRANNKITQVVQETTQNSNKITEHEQTIDEIKNTVKFIKDVTNTVEGTKTISLGSCIEGNLLELHIYGNNSVFEQLYPSDNLYPSDDLYPVSGDDLILVTDKDNNSKEYDLRINEVLRQKGEMCDEYILKNEKAQIIRRINKDGSIKATEEIEDLGEFVIPLKEGTNIITIKNYTAQLMAKWAVKNEFTDIFATKVEMDTKIEQTAGQIRTEVNKRVDKSEFGTMIEQNWEAIKFAWNQISQYLKMEGIDGKATLNIYDQNNNMLMSLSQDGQGFYDSMGNKIGTVGIVREKNKDTLAFAMNVDWDNVSESKSMAWGYFDKNGKFLPVFHLVGTYGAENSEYGGELAVEGRLSTENLKVIKNTIESGETTINLIDNYGNILLTIDSNTPFFSIGNLIYSSIDSDNALRINFSDCRLDGMKNVATTDEYLNYIAGSPNNHIFAGFKDGGDVIIFTSSSDKKLKKNIKKTSKIALDKIKKIKHREFNWKANDKHQDIGYIAQEMNEIDESFVHHTKYKDQNGLEKEDWQINTLSVLATATKAIQEQQEQIEILQEEVKRLKEVK